MSIDRIEKVVGFSQHVLDHYRKQRSTLPTSTPLMTYVHVRCTCRNCGNECIDQASISGAGNVRFGEVSPPGYCYDCRSVLADYGYYDEWEEEEQETYVCEFCGAEYGDGWSMCSCYDDDVDGYDEVYDVTEVDSQIKQELIVRKDKPNEKRS